MGEQSGNGGSIMAEKMIRKIEPYVTLYRDDKTGIACIHDGSSGCGISVHPNIQRGGSVRGMKHLGYWKKDARIVRSGGYIYNIDAFSLSWPDKSGGKYHDYEQIVANECMCQGCIERRSKSLSDGCNR